MSLADAARSSLAINGGQPIRASVLPYGRQSVDDEDIAAVVEVPEHLKGTSGLGPPRRLSGTTRRPSNRLTKHLNLRRIMSVQCAAKETLVAHSETRMLQLLLFADASRSSRCMPRRIGASRI